MKLQVHDADLECYYDTLKVYDGKGTWSDELTTPLSCDHVDPYTSSAGYLLVVFKSDSSIAKSGFGATVSPVVPEDSSSCVYDCRGTCDGGAELDEQCSGACLGMQLCNLLPNLLKRYRLISVLKIGKCGSGK